MFTTSVGVSEANRSASYKCGLCGKVKLVEMDIDAHEKKVRKSINGLVTYTDIHKCEDGILTINNLHIDINKHVRSFSMMELPDKKKANVMVPGIPSPMNAKNEFNVYKVDKMSKSDGYRIILRDKTLNVLLNIGKINTKEEEPEAIIKSKNNKVILEYYPCSIPFMNFKRKWFQELVDAIESLPPTRLGLFIEALRYVHGSNVPIPGEFEIEQLKTILSLHKTHFQLKKNGSKESKIRNIIMKYGRDKEDQIYQILDHLETDPSAPMEDLLAITNADLDYLIFLFLILENEGVLDIIRDFD